MLFAAALTGCDGSSSTGSPDPGADGHALDEALARGCPALHAAALKRAGLKSFGTL